MRSKEFEHALPGGFSVLAMVMPQTAFAELTGIVEAVFGVVPVKLVENSCGLELAFDCVNSLGVINSNIDGGIDAVEAWLQKGCR